MAPATLSPGDNAEHSISYTNYDIERYTMTIESSCLGPCLCYGASADWTPAEIPCDAETSLAPAALGHIHLPATVDRKGLPAVEHVDLKISMSKAGRPKQVMARAIAVHLEP